MNQPEGGHFGVFGMTKMMAKKVHKVQRKIKNGCCCERPDRRDGQMDGREGTVASSISNRGLVDQGGFSLDYFFSFFES